MYGDDPAVHAYVLGTSYAQSSTILSCTKSSPFYNTLGFFKSIPEDKFVACVRSWLLAVVKTYKVDTLTADGEHTIDYDKLGAITNAFEDMLCAENSTLLIKEWKELLRTADASRNLKYNSHLLKTFDESMHFKFGAQLRQQE